MLGKRSFTALIAATMLGTLWMACDDGETGSTTSSGTGGNGGTAGSTSGQGGDGGLIDFDSGSGSDGVTGCNPQNFTLQQAPPAEVYLVIDRSGSMNEQGSTVTVTKWDELNAAVDLALTQYEDLVRFGLLMYPSDDECATSGPQVGVADSNGEAIDYELNNTTPAGGTPTAAALNNAAASLSALGSVDSPKFVILATDGGPNCNYFLNADPSCACSYAAPDYCCTAYPGECFFGYSCLDDNNTLDVINELHTNQAIDTFVIGLAGTAEYEQLLNAMAQAGGRPQQGGTTDYYSASNQAELQSALQTIAVSVISCEIVLEQAPEYPDGVQIYMDGELVEHDPAKQNGWDYTDSSNTTIMLYGAACDTLQDGEEHTLTATFECEVF